MEKVKIIKAVRQQIKTLTAQGKHYEAYVLEQAIFDVYFK